MPPQSSPKSKQQAINFLKAFQRLCSLISRENSGPTAKKNSIDNQRSRFRHNDIKVDSDTLNTLKQILRDHRSNGKTLEEAFSSKVVACFDSIEGDICERLEPQVFCNFLEILLQADYTNHSERGLYLVGASLYRNNTNPDLKRGSYDRKKSEYVKLCLPWLLSEFVDIERPAGLRRCVGVLCIQLLANADVIGSSLGDGVEVKQKIGLLITSETDEFIRVIAGQIISAMLERNATLRDFWPADESKMVRDQFPQASQGEVGWTQRFSNYLDDLWPTLKDRPELKGNLCFAQKVEILPRFGFEDHDHTVYIFVENGMFRMMMLASESFDQWIDFPVSCIEEMSIVNRDDSSQISESGEVFFNLSLSDGHFCYLNSKSVQLKQVHIAAFFHAITELKEALQVFSRDLKITGGQCLSRPAREQDNDIRTSSQISESNAVVAWTEKGAQVIAKTQKNEGQLAKSDGSIAGEGIPVSGPIGATLPGGDVVETNHHQWLDNLGELSIPYSTPTSKSRMPPPKASYPVKKSTTQQRMLRVNRVRPVAKKPLHIGHAKSPGSLESAKPRQMNTAHEESSPSRTNHGSGFQPSGPTKRGERTKRSMCNSIRKNASSESVAKPKHDPIGGEYEIIPSPRALNQAKLNEGKAPSKKRASKTTAALAVKAQGVAQSQSPTKTPKSATPKPAKRYSLKYKRIVIDPGPPDTALKKTKRRTATVDKSEQSSDLEYRPSTSATKKKLNKTSRLPAAVTKSKPTAVSSPFKSEAHSARQAPRLGGMADERSGDILIAESDTSELNSLHGGAVPQQLNDDQISRPPDAFKQSSDDDGFSSSAKLHQRTRDTPENLPTNRPNTGSRMADALDGMLAHLSTDISSPILGPASAVRRSMKADCAESIEDATSLSIGRQVIPKPPHFVQTSEQGTIGLDSTRWDMPKTRSLLSGPYLDQNIQVDSCIKMVAVASEVLSEPTTPTRIDTASPATAAASWTEQQSELSTDTKKRKSLENEASASKKRRSSVNGTTNTQKPLRRSPRIQAMVERKSRQRQDLRLEKSLKQLERQSSEISPGTQAASIFLNLSAKAKLLVNDHIIRKPQVISFNARGAQNQGPSDLSRIKVESTHEKTTSLQPKFINAQDLKRKRDERRLVERVADKLDNGSPPKKRQSITPKESAIAAIQETDLGNTNEVGDSEIELNEVIGHTLSTNKEMMNNDEDAVHRPPRLKRTELKNSSQNSRVAYNGSPIPFKAVDHFGRIYHKMIHNNPETLDAFKSLAIDTHPAPFRVLRSPIILRSKVIAGNSAKARPSLPDENRTSYVAHERTGNGSYKGLKTREVVLHEEELPDPFLEAVEHRSSGFTDRLRNGSRNVVERESQQYDLTKTDRAVHHKKQQVMTPKRPTTTSNTPPDRPKGLRDSVGRNKTQIGLPKHIAWAPLDEFDATFVDVGNQAQGSGRSARGLTSDSSHTSHDEDSRRVPLEEKVSLWNAALKPHYQKFSEAVHRIGDEMIIRLSTEEDVMGLMVTQYQANGTKILDELALKREVEKRR